MKQWKILGLSTLKINGGSTEAEPLAEISFINSNPAQQVTEISKVFTKD